MAVHWEAVAVSVPMYGGSGGEIVFQKNDREHPLTDKRSQPGGSSQEVGNPRIGSISESYVLLGDLFLSFVVCQEAFLFGKGGPTAKWLGVAGAVTQ